MNYAFNANSGFYQIGATVFSNNETLTLENGGSLNFTDPNSTNARLYLISNFTADSGSTLSLTGADAADTTLRFQGLNNTIGTNVTYSGFPSTLNGNGIAFISSILNAATTTTSANTITAQNISVGSPFNFYIEENVNKIGSVNTSATNQAVVPQIYTSTAAANAVDQLVVTNAENYTTQVFRLGSNLQLASGQTYPFAVGVTATTNANDVIDLAGYQYDATLGSKGFTLQGWNSGTSATVPGAVYLSNSGTSSLSGNVVSGTNGVVLAQYFNLSTANMAVGTVPTVAGANPLISSPVILEATGTGTINNLGTDTTVASSLAFSPNSVFYYTGAGTAVLTSNRAIGQLIVGTGTSASTLQTNGTLTVGSGITVNSGATLDLDGQSVTESGASGATTGGLNGNGTVLDSNSTASVLTLNTGGGNGSFSGIVENNGGTGGTLALTINGAGTQTLSGANTYTGTTTVNGGTLQIGTGGSIANTASVIVNTGGSLLFGTTSTTNHLSAPVTLNGGTMGYAASSPGNSIISTGALTLTANSSLDFGSGRTGANTNILCFSSISTLPVGVTLTITDYLSSGTYALGATTDNGASQDALQLTSQYGSSLGTQL